MATDREAPRQQAAEDQAGKTGNDSQVKAGDYQQMDRAGELKRLALVRIDLFAQAQQYGRRQVGLLRLEIALQNLPAA